MAKWVEDELYDRDMHAGWTGGVYVFCTLLFNFSPLRIVTGLCIYRYIFIYSLEYCKQAFIVPSERNQGLNCKEREKSSAKTTKLYCHLKPGEVLSSNVSRGCSGVVKTLAVQYWPSTPLITLTLAGDQ